MRQKYIKANSGYIRQIDGLRCLAIISVLLFHINAAWLPGGFVGVDIFFVISGFVVAKSVEGVRHERFLGYLAWFYRRRFSRILPAMIVFVAITLLFSTLFVPIGFMSRFIELTGISSLVGLSNFLLLLKSGDYFSTTSEFNLFTHTWSLAVEEQYYLLFPVFSYFAMTRQVNSPAARRISLILVGIVSLGSLYLCRTMTLRWPEFAFYMLPTRFWELGLGYLSYQLTAKFEVRFAGTVRLKGTARLANAIAAPLSLVILVASFWFTDPHGFPWPGALLPCAVTAVLLILVALDLDGIAHSVLTSRAVTAIGRLSYSLYLWHWGVIVAMRWTTGIDTLPLQLFAMALMSVLAVASYRLVERPMRDHQGLRALSFPKFFVAFGTVTMLVGVLGGGLFVSKRYLGLFASRQSQLWSPYDLNVAGSPACDVDTATGVLGNGEVIRYVPTACRITQPGRRLFVVGDSHAGAYERMLFRFAREHGYPVTIYTLGGCKLLQLVPEPAVPGCPAFRQAAMKEVSGALRPGDVLFLPGLYIPRFRDQWGGPFVENRDLALTHQPGDNRAVAASDAFLAPVLAAGGQVLLELPKPVVRSALYRCSDWFNRSSTYCSAGWNDPRSELLQRRARVTDLLLGVAGKSAAIHVWDPFPTLCPGHICSGFRAGKPLFMDADHISGYANDLLYPSFANAVVTLMGTRRFVSP